MDKRIPDSIQPKRKSVFWTAVLSLILPGLGFVVAERIGLFIVALILACISTAATTILIGFFMLPVVWLWGIIHPVILVRRHNAALSFSTPK